MYLWRAVDDEGEVLDVLVQAKRDKRAALKLMRKLLKKHGFAPQPSRESIGGSFPQRMNHDRDRLKTPSARKFAPVTICHES